MPSNGGHSIPSEEKISQSRPHLRELVHPKWLLASGWIALASLLSLIVPWGIAKIVDTGIAIRDVQSLVFWLVIASLAQILSGILRYTGVCHIAKHRLTLQMKRMNALFKRVMHADMRALPDQVRGEAMGQILFASASESYFMEVLYTQGAALFVTMLGTVAALIYLSWQTAILSLILCPFSALLWLWLRRKIRPAARREFETQESLFREFTEFFTALTSIRALHRESQFTSKFETTSEQCCQAGYVLQKRLAVQGPFFDILQALVLIAVFGYGGYLVMSDVMTIGAIVAFEVYLARLFAILKNSTSIFTAWQQYLEGRARAHDIEHLPAAAEVHFEKAQAPELLNVAHLSFAFGDHVIWQDENLSLSEGEHQAILLPSGSGKTTLARCILGLYPADEGTIALPEGDVHNIGFVCQENVLFDGSIRDNISLLGHELTDEQYREVLYLCALEEVEQRFGTESIGDQGARLSGGEQRRVMLARALAAQPRLLIIDQMASELEPELCRQIFGRIRERYPQMGILYFGHRMPEWD
ncbi:MAG: ABC transporter ATP-binding protein [Proteobacteria bacterium]|nr:ABC transporter ATP-binding protein [Pseudomonadota bacterium]